MTGPISKIISPLEYYFVTELLRGRGGASESAKAIFK